MASYNKMVSMFAGHEEAAIFRRFDKLNRKTLLYMQAELIHLEAELKQIEIDDGSAPSEDEEKKVDDEKKFEEEEKPRNLSSVYDLKESAGTGNDLQWRKYKEIRGKLQAYSRWRGGEFPIRAILILEFFHPRQGPSELPVVA